MWLMGDKNIWGPRVGIAAQLAWGLMIAWDKLFGLIPITVIMFFIYIRNYKKWMAECKV